MHTTILIAGLAVVAAALPATNSTIAARDNNFPNIEQHPLNSADDCSAPVLNLPKEKDIFVTGKPGDCLPINRKPECNLKVYWGAGATAANSVEFYYEPDCKAMSRAMPQEGKGDTCLQFANIGDGGGSHAAFKSIKFVKK